MLLLKMKKINKENIVNWLIKCYYTIIGWYKCNYEFNPKDENEIIISDILNKKNNIIRSYKYLGKKTFYYTTQGMEPTTGVVYFESNKIIYPYWQVGVLKFKKI